MTYPRRPKGKQDEKEPALRARARDEVVAAICKRIAAGATIKNACAMERLSKSTLAEWRKDDATVELDVEEARAVKGEVLRMDIDAIANGRREIEPGFSTPNANVLLQMLERMEPDEWAPPKQRVDATVSVTADAVTAERVAAALAATKRDDGET